MLRYDGHASSFPSPGSKRQRRNSGRLVLNVGGLRFMTSRETLAAAPASYFGSLASGRLPVDELEDGSVFIDRDPKHFALILEYLRNSCKFTPPDSEVAQDELLLEAEFYGLSDLAAKVRRFKLLDRHLMTVQPRRPDSTAKYELCSLRGRRYAAAVFDVQNPDNFEVRFAATESLIHLPEYEANNPCMFVGLVPAQVQLSAAWERVPNPLPKHDRSPFGDPRWHAFGIPVLLEAERCEELWPKAVEVPPSLSEGIFLVLTDCHFKQGSEGDYSDAFLLQLVARGDFATASASAAFSMWSGQPVEEIQMSFARTSSSARLLISANGDDLVLEKALDLAGLGLDCNVPYRPAIFYGTKARVRIEDDYYRDF